MLDQNVGRKAESAFDETELRVGRQGVIVGEEASDIGSEKFGLEPGVVEQEGAQFLL